MSKIQIETAQHVLLNYEPAKVGDRILATIIDTIVMVAYYFTSTIAFLFFSIELSSEASPGVFFFVIIAVIILPIFLYHLVLELIWEGKTIGKWAMGIRVVKIDGSNPKITSYLLRWILRPIDIGLSSGMVALLTVIINGKGQRLGDIAAKTCVVKTKKKVSLKDTIYSAVQDDYLPVFPAASKLTDDDVNTIKEVIDSRFKYDYAVWKQISEQTQVTIQSKLGITQTELNGIDFLKKIMQDYNYLHKS